MDIKTDYKSIPNISVGKFKFNDLIKNYLDSIEYLFFPCKDVTEWDKYELKYPELIIYTENDIIESVVCYEKCFYKNVDLIGLHISDFINLSNSKPDEVEEMYMLHEEHPQVIYSFDDLGFQIWTRNNVIVTVSCSILSE